MMSYAFVIKNYSPIFYKVEILHKEYGKIVCMYSRNHQAMLLTTGLFIACSVEICNNSYRLEAVEILNTGSVTEIDQLEFIHQIALICIKLVPKGIVVEDIFNFLVYVYNDIEKLNSYNRKIILLRLFFLCELFDGSLDVYKIAMQDPFGKPLDDIQYLNKYVQIGFDKLFKEKNNNF